MEETQTTQTERKVDECGFIDIVQYNPQPVDDPKSHGLEFTEYIPESCLQSKSAELVTC